jgi:penicillin amidase
MRLLTFLVSTILTLLLVFVLNNKWGSVPALGKFLSPQQGFWQNAESADHDFSGDLKFPQLKGKVNVFIDDRLVPHIFADQNSDAYFVQGYLHAKFRLWQMEFQTFAAAGRVSEFLGNSPAFLRYDREQRRLGMVYGAENALREMEQDAETKAVADAYTEGVNAYINSLTESELPLEYKLLGYRPEPWSNLKIALFLKAMTKDLAGFESDIDYTNAKSVFSVEEMKVLFPQIWDSSAPIIPKGTMFAPAAEVPVKPATADSLYFGKDSVVNVVELGKPDRTNGSNNWAVSGQKTASGAPILCNDPHLGLTLPSIWYEMQITTPSMSVYGATFPGSPNIIIGFNTDIAFGFTNAQRDVKDYYQVRFRDASKKEYWFNGKWEPSTLRIDTIKRSGAETFYDTVAYTVFGPVMYDQSFTVDSTNNTALAVKWTAQEPSNELLMWIKLNRAKTYSEYEDAIRTFAAPGQNMLFASRTGEIALWQQAKFPRRWEGQGLFVMPGEDSSYMWQGYIPQVENPHIINPASGFIQSANQRPVDSTYPYFIPGNYIAARGITLNKRLEAMQQITIDDMKALQNDVFSVNASVAVPLMLKYLDAASLDENEKRYVAELKRWDFHATANAKGPTIYQAWFDSLEVLVWNDDFAALPNVKGRPDEQTLLEALLRDSSFRYIDNISTPDTETINQQVTAAFHLAAAALLKEEAVNGLLWWKHKAPSVRHLLRESVMPFARTSLQVGGWGNTINAIKSTHGPSWRMIVQLSSPTEAYGIYPGGQSGNPGSRYYDHYIDTWARGQYHILWLMQEEEKNDKRIKWTLTFNHA